ncbi:MAG: hypothetical protein K0Q95_185 [Bacteroidota bacterium]|jgi:hypothetical protein|nr:hypothetical protein [Bacteroidota bacterium]
MKKILLLSFFLPLICLGQTSLLPHIGLSALPSNTDPICSIPVYTGEMDTSGYSIGSPVNDFTLYTTSGDSIRLRDILASGKPVLLVGGNYTCPIFRQKIDELNDITNYYSGQLQVYLIYGVEAHPIVDPSPYSGFVWTTSQNNNEGVLYEQPDTYAERLELIDSLRANYAIVPEILVDGPCNQWWQNFGPAPNNAYLIDTNGIVRAKQGWFQRPPENMWCEIDSLLGTNSGNCTTVGNNGFFDFSLTDADSTVYGFPTDVLAVHGVLHNLSSTDNVEINISKQFVNIPVDWSTALCGDICYAPSVNATTVTIGPSDSLNFTFYFYTGANADSGYVKVRFKNANATVNTINQRFFGITTEALGINEQNFSSINIYPNPAVGSTTISADNHSGKNYFLYDHSGGLVSNGKLAYKTELQLNRLSKGFYYLKIEDVSKAFKIIKN